MKKLSYATLEEQGYEGYLLNGCFSSEKEIFSVPLSIISST